MLVGGNTVFFMMAEDRHCQASCAGRCPVRILSSHNVAFFFISRNWYVWETLGAIETPRVFYPLIGWTCLNSYLSPIFLFTVRGTLGSQIISHPGHPT